MEQPHIESGPEVFEGKHRAWLTTNLRVFAERHPELASIAHKCSGGIHLPPGALETGSVWHLVEGEIERHIAES